MVEKQKVLQVHPSDNVLVALKDLGKDELILFNGISYLLLDSVPAKHKFTIQDIPKEGSIKMYGVLVGKATIDLPVGSKITTANTKHASDDFKLGDRKTNWQIPDVEKWKDKQFLGYHRKDGSVGTANYWLVIPLVFCENRNIEVMKEALLDELGYARPKRYHQFTKNLAGIYKTDKGIAKIESEIFQEQITQKENQPLFKNVDGIKFLTHDGGCGGTRSDAEALCGLLAGYIVHPNCAGATVLSLGCQHAQSSILQAEIQKRNPQYDRPLYILEQQIAGTETNLIETAIKQTFLGLVQANEQTRKPAPINKLVIGLECGGSDGFSGLSANPAIGHSSDLIVALGGSVILSEFPELCGVEQELSDRCLKEETANKFMHLMQVYNKRAEESGSGFYMNPSPGNIKDGLITDAIKSAGAAKKAGNSPVVDVLDYPEKLVTPGLNLLCSPGNDVESTTAEVASGANIVLFTTGLGTPTGNPIVPVVKIASNTMLFNKMPDIIDINTGTIIDGLETIEEAGERILDYVIELASGNKTVHAVRHRQDDFIPWKRGVSL
ncbi:MAG: altronate dehydratase family protein [Bacteroidota bacterium]